MRSMTGFGRATHEGPAGSVTCEIRSVNHRALKVSLRVPGSLAGREPAFEAQVRAAVERGSVQGRLRVERTEEARGPLVDAGLARRYAEALADLHNELGLEGDPDLAMVVGLPGVIVTAPVDEEPPAELLAAGDAALAGALEALVAHRETEGTALATDFEHRLGVVEQGLVTVRDRAGAHLEALRDRLTRRLDELVPELPSPEVRETVAREIVMAAERADVSEEITRLETHLAAFRAAMAGGGAVGRRLDFLLQEMLREVNTIGSKSQDAAVAAAVVDMKVAVDRLKEQAANVE